MNCSSALLVAQADVACAVKPQAWSDVGGAALSLCSALAQPQWLHVLKRETFGRLVHSLLERASRIAGDAYHSAKQGSRFEVGVYSSHMIPSGDAVMCWHCLCTEDPHARELRCAPDSACRRLCRRV